MSGHTPGDPVIARSQQLRERMAGLKEMVGVFAEQLNTEVRLLDQEIEAHIRAQEGPGDDDPGTPSVPAPGA